jgi:hypothetical protein
VLRQTVNRISGNAATDPWLAENGSRRQPVTTWWCQHSNNRLASATTCC